MKANRTLLQHKYASVIETFSKQRNISRREAMDIFYKSYTYQDMRGGISDMHCRSDEYLAEELMLEQANYKNYKMIDNDINDNERKAGI